MAKYLIDTTVLINHLRGKTAALDFINKKEQLKISCVSLAELIQGARNKKELEQIKKLVSLFAVDWGSARINQKAVEILEKRYLKFGLFFFSWPLAIFKSASKTDVFANEVKQSSTDFNETLICIASPMLAKTVFCTDL